MASKNPVEIVAVLKFRSDAIEKAKPVMNSMIESTRKEKGCLRYDWYADSKRPEIFVVIETYTDKEALIQHQKSDYLQKSLGVLSKLLSGPPEIRILNAQNVAKL